MTTDIETIKAGSKYTPYRERHLNGGPQLLFRFENGYGASLVNHSFSYGNEIAVIKWTGDTYDLTYDTPVTDDVLGYLDNQEIEDTLDAIKALPKEESK